MNTPPKTFCEDLLCENPGAKVVCVSVEKPSDQCRRLCAACEEAFSWGVQHGRMLADADRDYINLIGHLRRGFAVLTFNADDAGKDGRFEAWAYEGPLDFDGAGPVTFGVGQTPTEAIRALDDQLAADESRKSHADGLSVIHLSDRELATILAALRYHQDENLQTTEHIPDKVIREIATDCGRLEPLNYQEVDGLCRQLQWTGSSQHAKQQSSTAGEETSTVQITIDGGNAEVTSKPTGVALKIVDYDVQGSQPEQLQRDDRGRPCSISTYPADEVIESDQ